MLKLPNIAQQTAYSLTREMYLAGCVTSSLQF